VQLPRFTRVKAPTPAPIQKIKNKAITKSKENPKNKIPTLKKHVFKEKDPLLDALIPELFEFSQSDQ
jgi:hypothetical protein